MVTSSIPPLADRVDVLRKERGLSLTDLSALTGIPRTTLSVKIVDADRFLLSQLRSLSKALNVPLSSLVDAA